MSDFIISETLLLIASWTRTCTHLNYDKVLRNLLFCCSDEEKEINLFLANLNEVKEVMKTSVSKKREAVNESKYDKVNSKRKRQASDRAFERILYFKTEEK